MTRVFSNFEIGAAIFRETLPILYSTRVYSNKSETFVYRLCRDFYLTSTLVVDRTWGANTTLVNSTINCEREEIASRVRRRGTTPTRCPRCN